MAKTGESLRDLLMFSRERYEEMLRAALEAYVAGSLGQAETILVGLMTLDPHDARPVKLLASTCLLDEKHREAEVLYQRAHELEPDDAYTLVALAESYHVATLDHEAERIVEVVLELAAG